ncbi:MAG: Flp pilus assembly complex ATPase component TadA [Planctomycetales bacterium]|nr:Flp pilus assembly complex ATPase component TadA [Planctomycetales bacterium]
MNDQWYFEIGDGNTYGPYPLEKLQKWAAKGNLMPTHRVRNADSDEWIIAAYVPGLELTTTAPELHKTKGQAGGKSLGSFVRGLGKKQQPDSSSDTPNATDSLLSSSEPPDIVALCDELLEISFRRNASDLHIDPEENVVLVQLRIDGVLEPLRKLPKSILGPLIGRLKVLSRMDIAEKRLPQDGRFTAELGPDRRRIHIRSACLPTTHGERITLRLLALETEQLTLNRLGMSASALKTFAEYSGQKQGMILLTGPTGSGKSTTLYAALRHRLANHPGRIITVEDPVEFDVVGVAQAEVDSGDKLRFDTALRNILRSDPDVIMIGEIRDHDSADIAVKAALTGHLVLSSLHTNSAAGVITRLVDMGIKPYQVAATLRLCIAQRLIRQLCPNCRKPRQLSHAEAKVIGQPDAAGSTIYEPGGCEKCHNRGFNGRIGLFEFLPIDEELARHIVEGCDEGGISRYARAKGIPTLRDDAATKLQAGLTSFSELVTIAVW